MVKRFTMSGDEKIVGIKRKAIADEDESEVGVADRVDLAEDAATEAGGEDAAEIGWIDDEDESASRKPVATIILAVLALAWTAFFAWAHFGSLPAGGAPPFVTPTMATELIVQWSIPLILLASVYLLLRRNSTVEARRFGRVAQSLSEESRALEDRLSRVNGELSLAREFLANQTQELQSLGRVSTERLTEHARSIHQMIESSDVGMRAIGQVSEAAHNNMEKLRGHLPVIANSAKDVANQIANAGRTAQTQIEEMTGGFERLNALGQTAEHQVAGMEARADEAAQRIEDRLAVMRAALGETSDRIDRESQAGGERLESRMRDLQQGLDEVADRLQSRSEDSAEALQLLLADLDASLASASETTDRNKALIGDILSTIETKLAETSERLGALDRDGGEASARLAFGLSALDDKLAQLSRRFVDGSQEVARYQGSADRLLETLQQQLEMIEQSLPAGLGVLGEQSDSTHARMARLTSEIELGKAAGSELGGNLQSVEEQLERQRAAFTELAGDQDAALERHAGEIAALTDAMRVAREEAEAFSDTANTRLVEALRDVQRHAEEVSREVRDALEGAIGQSIEQIERESAEALEKVVRGKAEEVVGKLDAAISRAVGATGDATLHLKDQLVKVEELTGHLERRVAEARERAEERTDNEFARRVALLTESLNSTSIDIAKVLSTDVSDTAWSAYLRGDRGVFTRRAVRLFDTGEAKEIAQFYEDDREFAEQVNRFVHDFEAMLRNLLSTRDGGVMGVALLSSDIGKLYVALAQAIERFRD